jgi:TolB protein
VPAQAQDRVTSATRASARLVLVALLIAIAFAAVVTIGSRHRVPPPFGPARPGLVVYTWDDHLFAMNADGSERRQLTFGSSADFRPTWSPDGTLIAYWSYGTDRSTALKVVSPDGDRQVTIVDRLALLGQEGITWAPDSRRLAFAGTPVDPPRSRSHIYVATADRPGATEIGGPGLAGFDPAWSPDGKQIAFVNLDPVDALWLMDIDGSNAHRLTTTPGNGWAFWNARWSQDGKRLAFLAGDDTHHDVWVIDAQGTNERNISSSPEDESWPTWSPDGTKVAYVRISSAGFGNFVVSNPDGSEPVTLSGPSVTADLPIWSPDGTMLFGLESGGGGSSRINGPHEGHDAMIAYDLLGKMPPRIVRQADEGSWQRLAE